MRAHGLGAKTFTDPVEQGSIGENDRACDEEL